MTNILILDIETAPNIAYVWRFFKENIGAKQVLENSTLLSVAFKWLGSDEVSYLAVKERNEHWVLQSLVNALDKADIVVAHYGDKFDFPYIQARLLYHGIKPPSPYKTIDTKKVAAKEFHFPSYSLEYLTKALNLGIEKGGHKKFPGFELWLEVLRDNEEAWNELREYNIIDVLALERLYLAMRPFIRNHPNVAVYNDHDDVCCPKCNSNNIQWRGYAHTQVGRYHRFQCNACGGWGRARQNMRKGEKNKNLAVNAVD